MPRLGRSQPFPPIIKRQRIAAVFNASVAAVAISVTLPTVTATYSATYSASVSPVALRISIPNVTASYSAQYSASVSPVALRITIPLVTAVSSSTASVSPVLIRVTVPTVTPTSTLLKRSPMEHPQKPRRSRLSEPQAPRIYLSKDSGRNFMSANERPIPLTQGE